MNEYERGFIDGMQKQAQSSVDKAVNAISKSGNAPIKGEGMIADPDEFNWKCDCAKCEKKYVAWKTDYDAQQKAMRGEA